VIGAWQVSERVSGVETKWETYGRGAETRLGLERLTSRITSLLNKLKCSRTVKSYYLGVDLPEIHRRVRIRGHYETQFDLCWRGGPCGNEVRRERLHHIAMLTQGANQTRLTELNSPDNQEHRTPVPSLLSPQNQSSSGRTTSPRNSFVSMSLSHTTSSTTCEGEVYREVASLGA
jgi:hypothetical protein